MADIFLSYCREDRPKAEALYRALKEEGLDVWWDAGLQAGETYDEKIQALLQSAKAVILLWSPLAVESEWVRGEGTIGLERDVLVPVMVKPVNIPVPFNMIHTVDLTNWGGDRADPTYQGVVARIKQLASLENVKPLKPPPNRTQRRMWQAIAAVAVVAVGGASLWIFKPWEAIAAATDPVIKARAERKASIAKLAVFGIQPGDLEMYDWNEIALKRLNPSSFNALKAEAGRGNLPAQAVLCAATYWGANSRPPDDAAALSICRKAAEAGEPAAQYYYSIMLGERSFLLPDEQAEQKRASTADAAQQMKKSAEQGFPWGEIAYGFRLMSGEGIAPDPAHAAELFKAAQDQGLPAADYAMADITAKGYIPGGPNPVEAARLTRLAADKGYAPAIYAMGDLYRDGNGVTEDLEQALKYYQAAAKQTDDKRLAERGAGAAAYIKSQIEREKTQPKPSPLDPLQQPPN